MPAERYYLDASFKEDEYKELKGPEFHHLSHVMRTRKGEAIELINGKGALAQALVHELAKHYALVKIVSVLQEPVQPCRIILAQAFPKPNRLEFILEKGTELGVDAFWLFPGQLSTKKEFYPHQLERAQAITIAAMKQCNRLTLPLLNIHPPINQWLAFTSMAFFGDLDPEAPAFETLWRQLPTPAYPLIFVTGPESGFSTQEEHHLRNSGAKGVKLHANILRTDTASLMALSLLSHWLMQKTKPFF